jgi:hypothetical protein
MIKNGRERRSLFKCRDPICRTSGISEIEAEGMARTNRLLIIECIPKSEKLNESLVLSNFLKMTEPDAIHTHRIRSKFQMLNYLRSKRDLPRFDFVHISAHGGDDNQSIDLPQGILRPEELPEGCFSRQTVALSACGMSRTGFVSEFMETTGASQVIAPLNDVEFIDAAVWFINFYYLVLHHKYTMEGAFERTNSTLKGKAKGGFQFWT